MAREQQKEIICPFYKDESDSKIIRCESIIATACTNFFDSEAEKEKHKECFCKEFNYKNCPLAKTLLEKYKAEEAREFEKNLKKYTEIRKNAQKRVL